MADILPVFGHEDAMACQVLEIIGGITPKALQTLEESCRETDVWSMEEGDDSVFYSDEDTPQQEVTLEQRRPVNSEADEIPLGEDEQEEEKVRGNLNADTAQETIKQENDKEEFFKIDIEHELESANPNTIISGILVSTCEEALQLRNTDSEEQSSSKDFTSSSEITRETVGSNLAARTVHPQPLEVYREPGKSHSNFQDVSQDDPSEGSSIPSLSKKKSSHPKSFNHLTSSKYSTTSYRRIRRGNTRQKIEEFEYMIMNL